VRAGSSLAAVGVAYALAGFVLAPHLVGRALDRFAARAPGRTVRVGHTAVNPFDLTVVLEQVSLRDPDAGVDVRADRAVFDFGVAALLGRRVAFDAMILERPDVSVTRPVPLTGVGGFVDAWAARLAALSPPVSVGRLELSQGRFALTATDLELRDVAVTAERFATDAGAPATYTLSLAEPGGVRVRSQGRIGIAPPAASGRLELTGFDLGRTAADRPARPAPAGELDVRGAFRVAGVGSERRATLTEASLSVRGLTWPFAGGPVAAAEKLGADLDADVTAAPGGIGVDARLMLDGRNVSVSDGAAADATRLRFDRLTGDARAVYGPDGTRIDGSAELAGDGKTATVELEASADGLRRFDVSADNVAAALLSPYALRFAGRPLRAGTLSGEVRYRIRDNRLEGSLRVASSGLDVGRAVTVVPAPNAPLPLALAVALLEDPAGRLELSVPLAAQLQDAAAYVPAVVGGALAAAVSRTAAEPFDALGRVVGTAAPMLASVPFDAGSAEITASAAMRLSRLAAALAQRPKLALTVGGGFDRKIDRDALAAQQIRLHVALATAGATEFSPAQFGKPPPIDFASPRAQDVLDEFAGERLDAEQVQTIASLFPGSAAAEPAARENYYRALFDALVAQEPITDAALTRLGHYRAQSIVDTLQRLDVDAARLRSTGAPAPAAADEDAVLVPLGITAFEPGNGSDELDGRVDDR
jgi:hypothetical protein